LARYRFLYYAKTT